MNFDKYTFLSNANFKFFDFFLWKELKYDLLSNKTNFLFLK